MPKPATANPAVAANPPAPSPAVAPNPAAPPSPPAGARLELAGTLRMYLAHAPLRTAEVANPDSPGNRQILEAMVRKALQNPAPVALKARPKP